MFKAGPPANVKPRPYPLMLELLENEANKILTTEYSTEIIKNMAVLESSTQINPSMIDMQPEIQWFMRPFLLDFIVELHSSFKLQPQTLFLALNLIDRYCARRIVFKRHYQLVGCTALWIASKYEDKKSRVPTLRELSIMCRQAYDEEMFVQMERHILSTLEWSLGHPTLEDCLQLSIQSSSTVLTPYRYNVPNIASSPSSSVATSTISAITAVGRFLCELSLYDRNYLLFPTSLVSITANLIACTMLQVPSASDSLQHIVSNYLDLQTKQRFHSNEEFFDDESENKHPEIEGAFLAGFDDSTLNSLRKISLLFMNSLNNVTDVLQNKYKSLGVIQVVQNFINKYINMLQPIFEAGNNIIDLDLTSVSNNSFSYTSDYILGLSYDRPSVSSLPAPLTPPSASSSYSIFSQVNSSTSSILTPTNSCDSPITNYISSSPAICSTATKVNLTHATINKSNYNLTVPVLSKKRTHDQYSSPLAQRSHMMYTS